MFLRHECPAGHDDTGRTRLTRVAGAPRSRRVGTWDNMVM
jgi:hypothetical protein